MINYKQLAIDLIAIQAEAVGRGTELLERAKMGEFDECGRGIDECGRKFETRKVKKDAKQCFEEDIRRNHSREDRDLYGQAARDAALGRKGREILNTRMYLIAALNEIAEAACVKGEQHG